MRLPRVIVSLLIGLLTSITLFAQQESGTPAPSPGSSDKKVSVYVIPITEAIGKPNLYILRRGLKEAIENDVDMVLLKMDTPGGRVDVTIEMMEMLAKFDGITATYVNDEAISAGSFIAASTQEIYFSPNGIMGASAVVMGGGQEIPETARLKIESYLRASIRSITAKYPYRSEVIRAMLDANYELKIEDEVVKPSGELLTLTANEAMKNYGNPPRPLLGKGIYTSVEQLLDSRFGSGNYEIKNFQVTYSERMAKWMETFAPALLGIGLLMLFLEFKTPGFGIFGTLGIVAVVIFFISQYIAGLAGNEVFLLFALGIVLVLVELFFFPGTLVAGVSGLFLILASLLWAMVDFWPGEPIDLSLELFATPLVNLVYGLSIAVAGLLIFGRFFKGSFFERMLVLEESVGGSSTHPAADQLEKSENSDSADKTKDTTPSVGSIGTAATDLFPTGRIEVEGQRYEARSALGQIQHGSAIKVVKRSGSNIIVEEVSE